MAERPDNLPARRTGGVLPLEWEPVHGERGGLGAWLEYVAYRGLVGALAALPISVQDKLAGGLARVAARLDKRHTASARAYLDQAFGGDLTDARRDELVLASYRHMILQTLRDRRFNARVLGPDMASHYDLHLCDAARELGANRQGFLVVTAHIGAWEALGSAAHVFGFDPGYVVSRPPKNRPLSVHFQRVREQRGMLLIHRKGAVKGITRVVEAGGCVALMLDQRAHGKTLLAPFFGRPAHCERSIAVLIRRLKVPVVFAAAYETGVPFQYEVHMPRVMQAEELAGMKPEQILTEINGELERMILARPEQYFWLHDRYRKAPPADPVADAPPNAVQA